MMKAFLALSIVSFAAFVIYRGVEVHYQPPLGIKLCLSAEEIVNELKLCISIYPELQGIMLAK